MNDTLVEKQAPAERAGEIAPNSENMTADLWDSSLPSHDVQSSACAYQNAGLSVIPIKPLDKRPAVEWADHQKDHATAEQAASWFRGVVGNRRNIAVVCGAVSGNRIVLDFDDPAAYAAWAAKFPEYAKTATVGTPRGGRHVHFTIKGPIPRCCKLPDKAGDLKGEGGYVLMPPSEIDGKAYRLVGGDLLKPVEIASLAEVGFSGLGQPRSDANPAMQPVHDGQRCERWVNEAMERASSGNRNDVGLWLACQLRDGGLPLEAAKPPMLEYAKNVLPGGHPYTTEEALATLESAYRRDPREPAAAPVSGLHIRRQRETRNQLVFTELSDLLIEQPEEVPWIVDELLPAGGSSILAGEPKAGKSTAARSLMLAVVEGGDFAGRSCQPCPVLYLCLEDKRSEVQKHFQAMTGTGQMQRENIYIHTGLAPLNRDESLRQLEDCIEAKKAKLLVIDVLQRFVRITDPNNYGEVSAIMEPLTDLARRSGCHILSLHHAGKGQGRTGRTGISRVLGSTAFAGAVDTAMFYSRKRGDRTLEASHLRYGRELPETTMILDPKTRRIVEGASYAERGEEAIEGEILDTLGKAGQPMTEEEIRTAVGGDRGKVGRVLRAMRVIGKVGHKGEGKPKHPYLYSFPVLPISTNEQRAVEDQQGTQNRAA